jgi:hypothetical protein
MQFSFRLFFAAAMMVCALAAQENLTAQEPTIRCDPPAGSLGRLTKAQKTRFMKSQDMFLAARYADALEALRSLLTEVPQDTPAQSTLAERTAEAAIGAGERAYAISLLKPIEDRDGTDCPARTLLARAYAEDGQTTARDAEISALDNQHKQAPQSSIGKLDAFVLEQHSLAGGWSVSIAYFLRPSGPHNTHLLSEILDASGSLILRIELDSDDPDQVYYREKFPDLAAKGERRYSLDAISGPTLNGGKIEHELIQFFDGAPSYDTVRGRILDIAERSTKLQKK